MPAKSRAQIKREIDEVLARKPGGGAKAPGDVGVARETSERRIAALIANGEDVRNSPAWRDALSESRMIDLISRSGADVPIGRRIGTGRHAHTRVDIRWYAIPNENKRAGGFLPMIEEDGKERGDTWRDRGYSKADAEAMAEERAHDVASRFVGDWNVSVTKGRPTLRGKAHAQKKNTLLKDIAPGLRNVAQRSLDAENRFLAALSIYGDEPGILVQRSRINVRPRETRTFIRDASRAEVAP